MFRPAAVFPKLATSSFFVKRQFGFNWVYKWLGQDTLIWLQQPLDLTVKGLKKRMENNQWKKLVESQRLDSNSRNNLGPELAGAKFILENKGKVKFTGIAKWYVSKGDGLATLPIATPVKMTIEAIDASDTNIMYESFENLENLENVQYMNLSNCQYIDDWCVDKLSMFRSTLKVLNLSKCHNITDNGLASLHRFKNLRRLTLENMKGLKNPQITAMMLEEVLPQCFVKGINYENEETLKSTKNFKINHTPNKRLFLNEWGNKAQINENEKLAQHLKFIDSNNS